MLFPSKESYIPAVMPMLETVLELMCECVCAHTCAIKDWTDFTLFENVALVICHGPPLQPHLLPALSPCPWCSRHMCLLLVCAAHETLSCLGPWQ